MTCDDVRGKLTAYLDGELEDDRGSAVRGHLRGCLACQQIATDESALRDGLRALPTVDPPPSLWTNVQARLAEAEVADAERPAWRRTVARMWTTLTTATPRLAFASAAVAAAVVVIAIHAKRPDTDDAMAVASAPGADHTPTAALEPPPAARPQAAPLDEAHDVTAELAAAPGKLSDDYRLAVDRLMHDAEQVRPTWNVDRQQAFDTHVTVLRAQIARETDDRHRQRAYRALIRYVQGAVVRDEIALAEIGGRR